MKRFIDHCHNIAGTDTSKMSKLNPANRSLPTAEIVHLPWFQEEIECIQTESIRVGKRHRFGSIDMWLIEELKKKKFSIVHLVIGSRRICLPDGLHMQKEFLFWTDLALERSKIKSGHSSSVCTHPTSASLCRRSTLALSITLAIPSRMHGPLSF